MHGDDLPTHETQARIEVMGLPDVMSVSGSVAFRLGQLK